LCIAVGWLVTARLVGCADTSDDTVVRLFFFHPQVSHWLYLRSALAHTSALLVVRVCNMARANSLVGWLHVPSLLHSPHPYQNHTHHSSTILHQLPPLLYSNRQVPTSTPNFLSNLARSRITAFITSAIVEGGISSSNNVR